MTKSYYSVTIPTDVLGDFEFAIYGRALGNNFNISSLITISIIARPVDDTLNTFINMPPFFDKEPSP